MTEHFDEQHAQPTEPQPALEIVGALTHSQGYRWMLAGAATAGIAVASVFGLGANNKSYAEGPVPGPDAGLDYNFGENTTLFNSAPTVGTFVEAEKTVKLNTNNTSVPTRDTSPIFRVSATEASTSTSKIAKSPMLVGTKKYEDFLIQLDKSCPEQLSIVSGASKRTSTRRRSDLGKLVVKKGEHNKLTVYPKKNVKTCNKKILAYSGQDLAGHTYVYQKRLTNKNTYTDPNTGKKAYFSYLVPFRITN